MPKTILPVRSAGLLLSFISALIFTAGILHAEEKDDQRNSDPPPENAQVTLHITPDFPWVGDWMKIEIKLKNTGRRPCRLFQSLGWESRAFQITVTDENGVRLPHIREAERSSGLILVRPDSTLEPGETHSESYPLDDFVHLEKPGKYHIRVVCCYTWKKMPGKEFPAAETELVVAEPDLARIKKKVTTLCNSPNSDKERDIQLNALHSPLFLPSLFDAAQTGKLAAIRGMANIQTTEATEKLISLLKHRDKELALTAARILATRMPCRFVNPYDQDPSPNLWDDRFNADFLSYAKTLLSFNRRGSVGFGASIYEAIGSPPDVEALQKAIQEELMSPTVPAPFTGEPRLTEELSQEDYPLEHLLKAVNNLIERGYRWNPKDSELNGQAKTGRSKRAVEAAQQTQRFILCSQLEFRDIPLPENKEWKKVLHDSLHSNLPELQIRALHAIPHFVDPEWVPDVVRLLGSRHAEVMTTAFDTVSSSDSKDFVDPVLKIVQTSTDKTAVVHASAAAWRLGKHMEVWQAWIDKLSRFTAYKDTCEFLCEILDRNERPPLPATMGRDFMSERDCLTFQKRWRDFFQAHGEELANGKRYSYKDPIIRPLMVSPSDDKPVFRIFLSDGTYWP